MEHIDMLALAREAAAQARAAEQRASEDVEFIFEALPDAVGDRALLSNVFVNLFSNALKYAKPARECEKPRVVVTGAVEDGECLYHVADNGRGFDMRFSDKLFVLFERLHSQDEIEGTGVGLAMVARIVKRHGGRVWAKGSVGEGARFSFALPLGEEA
jgi:light-regulated signal transduction histidine kinase (bacteriophytochrome)